MMSCIVVWLSKLEEVIIIFFAMVFNNFIIIVEIQTLLF